MEDLCDVAARTMPPRVRASGGQIMVITDAGERVWLEIEGLAGEFGEQFVCTYRGKSVCVTQGQVMDWRGSNGEWEAVAHSL